jgi:hypothetical protein
MAKRSKWTKDDRKKLLKFVQDGMAEQEIREKLGGAEKPMTSAEFAQQLKMAMVESGQLKQASRKKVAAKPKGYEVTSTGRLTITDFAELTGAKTDATFALERPRGKSNAWRLVPLD